jgi:hypothetical protein
MACEDTWDGRLAIHVESSGDSSSVWELVAAFAGFEVSGSLTEPGGGFNSAAFLAGKSFSSADGTPAVMVQRVAICDVMAAGSVVVDGRTRTRSQCVLCARRGVVERVVGRIIQRTTRAWVMGVIEWVRREERKEGIVVVGVRERM